MDLFIGIIVGLVIGIGLMLVSIRIKRHTNKFSPGGSEFDAKTAAYHDLIDKVERASSIEEYTQLKETLRIERAKLYENDYMWLVAHLNVGIQEAEAKQKERERIQPKLENFRMLKNIVDQKELFRELHLIYLEVDNVITFDQLEAYGNESDKDWYFKTYDELLRVNFRQLLLATRNGTIDDYQKVMTLWNELDHLYSTEDDDRRTFVTKYLAQEWNEMIVRFKKNPDTYDEVFGLDDVSNDDYSEIVAKARREHDFLSLRLSLLFAEEESDFRDVLARMMMKDFKTELDIQYLALGFKPEEEERSV